MPAAGRRPASLVAPLVLVLQNLVIYHGHYFRGVGIPWDFPMSYYAMVAFWTAGIREGVFPQWIPFQQMGFPFALQLQSGINYLPLWIIPALNIPYTMRAAVVVQCLHVLAGSLGMFALGRHVLGSPRYALVGAVAFQCFGGFYSNAEHIDIVRAFAYAPWLLHVFALGPGEAAALPRRALFIPPVLYLFLTGAYPGNVIAAGILVPLFLGIQLADRLFAGVPAVRLLGQGARMAGLGALGVGMAAAQYGPVVLFRDLFVRTDPMAFPREGLWIDHLPGLFLSNAALPGEISMTSTYVSLPMLLLACCAPRSALRSGWTYLATGAVAAILVTGDHSPLGPLIKNWVPIMALSRFPSSDYRVFVAMPLLVLATAGLRAIVEHRLTWASLAVRGALSIGWLAWGLARVAPPTTSDGAGAIAVAGVSVATIAILRRKTAPVALAVAAAVLLVAIDAARVLPDIQGWRQPDMAGYELRMGLPRYTRNRGRRLAASYIFRSLPATRPARIAPRGLIRWYGYVDGEYLTTDLTPSVLRASGEVSANELYSTYMLREWRPLVVDPAETGTDADGVVLSNDQITAGLAGEGSSTAVRQTRYGVNEIVYQVSLAAPRVLVENEMYFPGWTATLGTGNAQVIEAVPANGVFRAWRLPAGEYTMVARFEFPHLRLLWLAAGTSTAIWLAIWFLSRESMVGSAHS
jgi:hypothetical protein